MRPPCEIVVNKVLPNVRAELVKILVNEYGMRQVDIAEMFGITQASVSQYLTAARGRDEILIEMIPDIEKYARDMAEQLVKGERDEELKAEPWAPICEICKKVLDDKRFCEYCKKATKLKNCGMCGDI